MARAVEVAIAAGDLPASARSYRKVGLLEALSEAMGLAPNALRNLYYRDEAKFEIVVYGYIGESPREVSRGLQALQFREFSPIVWRRPLDQLKTSRETLNATLMLLQAAERSIRESEDAPIELRREVGMVAAEVMACALTFFTGRERWGLLKEGERIFRSAMSTVSLEIDVEADDAAQFAKFWENRATVCGLEWDNIWDDPSLPPTVGDDVVDLALRELDRAASWLQQLGARPEDNEGERVRQLLADKSKWLAKAGRFSEARSMLEQLGAFSSLAAQSDRLLLKTLELVATNHLDAAYQSASQLAELLGGQSDEISLAPVMSSIMVHNIELLRGRRPRLTAPIETFLRENPVVASEMVNLPRYKDRLAALGYVSPAPAFN